MSALRCFLLATKSLSRGSYRDLRCRQIPPPNRMCHWRLFALVTSVGAVLGSLFRGRVGSS